MRSFKEQLKSHDWYYHYSDDHRYWSAGEKEREEINTTYYRLECPFTLGELKMWSFDMVVGDYTEVEPGKWFKLPKEYDCTAPAKREDLITSERYDEIDCWLQHNDT